jgi:hypothetical protein
VLVFISKNIPHYPEHSNQKAFNYSVQDQGLRKSQHNDIIGLIFAGRRRVSKESKNKKRLANTTRNNPVIKQPSAKHNLTAEERAGIIRDRLANRPVIMFRYPGGRLNKRLIITLAILIIALAIGLYFITKTG